MKAEYLKRRDYIMDKMSALDLRLSNQMVPFTFLLRFQLAMNKIHLNSVKILRVKKLLLSFLV